MEEIVEIGKVVAAMPPWALLACIVLGGFGLAAYAIHAVVSVTKRRQ